MRDRKVISKETSTSQSSSNAPTTSEIQRPSVKVNLSPVLETPSRTDKPGARSKSLSAVRPVPRRGLSREEAAMYIGISTGKFDELVRTGRMPDPKRIDNRKVWDVHGLDLAFDELPSDGNSWDDV
jgi:hypothetical protein